jgi:GH15 family glucan-1,4-alpha-glucosidase
VSGNHTSLTQKTLNSNHGNGTPHEKNRDGGTGQPDIGDYALIGDCRSAALVAKTGSMDWLCWPRFDSSAIFSRLLDPLIGGYWQVSPTDIASSRQSYIRDSNLLQTHFETRTGAAVLTDFMPIATDLAYSPEMNPDYEIVRTIKCSDGEMMVQVEFMPRANYGLKPVRIRQLGKLGHRLEVGRGVYWLRSSRELHMNDHAVTARISLKAGESVHLSLTYTEEAPAVLPPLDEKTIAEKVKCSAEWWQAWAKRAEYDGEYRDAVVRSALALKLMSFAPSGAIVAAPTTSLPEQIGGPLNWDYRFCWLRDSSLTVRALLQLGYWEEASDFTGWMLHATRLTQPELRVLYTVFGETPPRERELWELAGYRGSRPVRVGNAAREQLQLDVYGEVIDAASQFASKFGHLDKDTQKVLIGFGNYVVKHWSEADQGIWEPRGKPEHHTHSRLLCWAALDRLITLHEHGMLPNAPIQSYKGNAEQIRQEIETRAWNESLNSYVSTLDGDRLDASLLLLSWYGFEKANSPRMRSTYCAILERLGTSNGLLYRYESTGEGAFAICSFWEAEYLALGGGSLHQAHALFRRLLGFQNHVGLYAEEIDARHGGALGNFPQAFTHIGLIGAALSIRQREKGEAQLTHRPDSASESARTVGVSS